MGTFYGGGSSVAASQTEMEAATSNIPAVPVTPLSINWHPGVAKAWLVCNAAGAIQASHNITSITDTGAGAVTVTIATDFSSSEYCIIGTALLGSSAHVIDIHIDTAAAGSFLGNCRNEVTTETDPTRWFFACFGDQ